MGYWNIRIELYEGMEIHLDLGSKSKSKKMDKELNIEFASIIEKHTIFW